MDEVFVPGKWHWMMDYCKRNLLHPGDSKHWEIAEKAYNEAHNHDK